MLNSKILWIVLLGFLSLQATAQNATAKYDLSTIDGTIEALYASISGEKGVERDWETFHMLFTENARLMPTGLTSDGKMTHRSMSPDDYKENSGPWLVENGFFEEEIHRKTDRFGPIAHVFSTYTSRNTKGGELIARGINSIQLFNDGSRWWVMSIYWASETENNPIPGQYDAQ